MEKIKFYFSTFTAEDALALAFLINLLGGGMILLINSHFNEPLINASLIVLAVCSFVVAFISAVVVVNLLNEEEEEA